MAENNLALKLQESTRINIEFKDVIYTVKNGTKDKKQVIKGVSGTFKSGELTAIMGPSGAGKTSLLSILTGFQTLGVQGTITSSCGSVTKIGTDQYRKQSCYILQDDQLNPFFTINEIMNIAANLKLGQNVSPKTKRFHIDQILNTLSLMKAKDTRCQRLSGGQKKRLSIALELIDNPPIMFLDEPTTGLDSSSSNQCIGMLKNLARDGRNIICTIHQPSATLYEIFDHVYVMAEGKCIYQGGSMNTVAYLASVGLNCPQYHNPADYLLEVANKEYGNFTDVMAEKAVNEHQWRKSITSSKFETEKKEISYQQNTNDSTYSNLSVSSPSEWFKFCILVNRSFVQIYRDWTISHLKLLLHLLVGMFLGIFFYQYGNDASKTIKNIGFFIISAVFMTYTSLMPAVLKFPSELAVLKKERFNNWYQLKTYYLAFLVSDIPLQLLFSLVYVITSYFLSSQPPEASRFFMVYLVFILVSLSASSFGLVLGSLVNPINGTFLGAILTALQLCLAGFLIMFKHMPKPIYLMTYISFLSYSHEALIQAVYGYSRETIPCPEEAEYCHLNTPELLLRELGMEKNNYWSDVLVLFCNFLILRIIAFCTLKRRLKTN